MALVLLSTRLREASPPWLQRLIGAEVMGAFGDVLDQIAASSAAGVKARFPTATSDPDALALIGRERRIRRGPGEPAETYARRLAGWWDDHRARGGPYALLRQLFEYFTDSLGVPIDLVYQSGTRYQMDAAGVVVRDAVPWNGDGSGNWAATIWIFFHLGALFPVDLVTQDGDPLVTQDGDQIVGLASTAGVLAAFTDADKEVFRAVPREWSAAHIPYVTIVLLYGTAELWDYPQPVGAWDDPVDAVWQDASTDPLVFTTEAT